MPIADAIMIVATAPAYAAIFARIFLKYVSSS